MVIDSLVKVIIDPEANHGQVVAAAKVLGTVTEVAAFTERKEVHTITSSEDARAKVMQADLLLLDEPTANLDGAAREQVIALIPALIDGLGGEHDFLAAGAALAALPVTPADNKLEEAPWN